MGYVLYFCAFQISVLILIQLISNIIIFSVFLTILMQPLRKLILPTGLKDISVCSNQHIFLAVVYNTVRIYHTHLLAPYISIELNETPKFARLSPCGKYFYIYNTDNQLLLYDTKQGTIVQSITGVPSLTKTIKFSKNSQKLIFASTQTFCMWNIPKCSVDVRTQLWKNISCYDINNEGTQFVIGTYQGVVFVLDFLAVGSCSQVQIKKHKSRVAAVCCHEQKIISVSDDGYFLISNIGKDDNNEKIIQYREMKIKTIPKDIQSIGNNFYMFNHDGLTWFSYSNGLTLTGFTDYRQYKPLTNEDGKVLFVSVSNGEIEWWPESSFKTTSQIQRSRSQKQKQKQLGKENEQNGLNENEKQLIKNKESNMGNENKKQRSVLI